LCRGLGGILWGVCRGVWETSSRAGGARWSLVAEGGRGRLKAFDAAEGWSRPRNSLRQAEEGAEPGSRGRRGFPPAQLRVRSRRLSTMRTVSPYFSPNRGDGSGGLGFEHGRRAQAPDGGGRRVRGPLTAASISASWSGTDGGEENGRKSKRSRSGFDEGSLLAGRWSPRVARTTACRMWVGRVGAHEALAAGRRRR